MIGRPTKFNQQLAKEVCTRLATGESLRSICRDDHIPTRQTIHRWIIENAGEVRDGDTITEEGFYYQYARAKEIAMDELAEIALEVAKTPLQAKKTKYKADENGQETRETVILDAVDRARLHVDTLKWYVGKVAPKKYGNQTTVKHQQLDKEGQGTDPAPAVAVISADAQSILKAAMKAVEDANPAEQSDNDPENTA